MERKEEVKNAYEAYELIDSRTTNIDIPKSPLLTSWRLWTNLLVMAAVVHMVISRMGMSMAIVCMVDHNPESGIHPESITVTAGESDSLRGEIGTAGKENASFYLSDEGNDLSFHGTGEMYGSFTEEAVPNDGNLADGRSGVKTRPIHRCNVDRPPQQDEDSRHKISTATFKWSKAIQGQVLSSFFYTFCPGQVVGGWMTDKLGGRHTLIFSVGVISILILLHPLAAYTHHLVLMAVRSLLGFFAGIGHSSVAYFLPHWGSSADMGLLMGINYAGYGLGIMITHPLVSNSCLYGPFGGWPSSFYATGIIGGVWVIVCFFLLHNQPASHPFISENELQYLKMEGTGIKTAISKKTEWKKLLTSRPIWVAFLAFALFSTSYYTMTLYQPIFLRDLFGFPIDQNGWMSSLPWIVEIPACLVVGAAVDLMKKKGFTMTFIRKFFSGLGFTMAALVLVLIVEANCDLKWLAAASLTIAAMGNCMALAGGSYYLAVDLAPACVSTVFGLLNFSLNSNGYIVPAVSAYIVKQGTREEWRTFFWVIFAANISGVLLFQFFGSAETLPWAAANDDPDIKNLTSDTISAGDTKEKQEPDDIENHNGLLEDTTQICITGIDIEVCNSNKDVNFNGDVKKSTISIELHNCSKDKSKNSIKYSEEVDATNMRERNSSNFLSTHKAVGETAGKSHDDAPIMGKIRSNSLADTASWKRFQDRTGRIRNSIDKLFDIKSDKNNSKSEGLRKVHSALENCEDSLRVL